MEQCVIVGIADTGSILDIILVLVQTNLCPQSSRRAVMACRSSMSCPLSSASVPRYAHTLLWLEWGGRGRDDVATSGVSAGGGSLSVV